MTTFQMQLLAQAPGRPLSLNEIRQWLDQRNRQWWESQTLTAAEELHLAIAAAQRPVAAQLSEVELMNEALGDIRQHGLPSFVTHWDAETEEGWGE